MPKKIGTRWLVNLRVALRSRLSVSFTAELGREECFILSSKPPRTLPH